MPTAIRQVTENAHMVETELLLIVWYWELTGY